MHKVCLHLPGGFSWRRDNRGTGFLGGFSPQAKWKQQRENGSRAVRERKDHRNTQSGCCSCLPPDGPLHYEHRSTVNASVADTTDAK